MPFIAEPDEPDGYFNLPTATREPLVRKLLDAGVCTWFCGHYHRNAGGVAARPDGRHMEVVVTAAVGANLTTNPDGDPRSLSGMSGITLSREVSGLRVVRVGERAVTHEWRSLAQCVECEPGAPQSAL